MDDLSDLQARVAAAQEMLRLNADDQRKYGLRLNDVVTIVEGSLSRQQDEMKRLQDAAVTLRIERDATKVAENQTKGLYEAALVRLNLLQAQNEQLRNMVMTLLNVIEGRESASALQTVLQRLETSVKEAAVAPASVAAEVAAEPITAIEEETPADEDAAEEPIAATEAIEPAAVSEAAAEDADLELGDVAEEEAAEPIAELADTAEADEIESDEAIEAADEVAGTEDESLEPLEAALPEAAADEQLTEEAAAEDELVEGGMAEAATSTEEPLQIAAEASIAGNGLDEEALEALDGDAESDDMPEDLGDMSMNGHRDIVTDADALVADEAAEDEMVELEEIAPAAAKPVANAAPDETLVSALLDAEKALIEAGASGVANINSPVAEIIRRISLRTREFSEASGS